MKMLFGLLLHMWGIDIVLPTYFTNWGIKHDSFDHVAHLHPFQLSSSEILGIENVTVILDFANNQESSVTYSVRTDPQADVMLIGNSMARLVLQYDTQYCVTVVASYRCSQNETVLELYFS